MRILIAPNAFKNSLNAADVAESIRAGFAASRLRCSCECFPVGDGGDGTAELLISHLRGKQVTQVTVDALGRQISSSFGLLGPDEGGYTAVIEMADSSGLRQLTPEEYDPMRANTFGTGGIVRSALDKGVKKIIMGVGGSATIDGGTGILRALGVKFMKADRTEIVELPAKLNELSEIDITALDSRIAGIELIILCDVANSLLGPSGAAAVFGPQKGADAGTVDALEKGLQRFRDVTLKQTGFDMTSVKHGGAAGGIAAGLAAFCHATLVNGIDHFLELSGFSKSLAHADLVITGEGSLDEQTLQGKAPYGVALRAKKAGIPVIGIAGRAPLQTPPSLGNFFDAIFAIGHEPAPLEQAMKDTAANLTRTAKAIGDLLAIKN